MATNTPIRNSIKDMLVDLIYDNYEIQECCNCSKYFIDGYVATFNEGRENSCYCSDDCLYENMDCIHANNLHPDDDVYYMEWEENIKEYNEIKEICNLLDIDLEFK